MMKKPKRVGIALDMTPLVDIAFLMLIFFMATTVFKPPEKDAIYLPESSSEVKAPEGRVISISVTADGRMSIEYRAGGQRVNPYVSDPEQLRGEVQNARRANPSAYILIKADRAAQYGILQDVMKILQEENATRFNVITERKVSTLG